MFEIKIRYKSFDQFFRLNKENFQRVQAARKDMRSPAELAMTGSATIEAEKFSYQFLNLKQTTSDLMFGLGASVLDAKHDIKTQTAVAYRELAGKPQGEKKIEVEAQEKVVAANKTYNDLNDLKEYLMNKYSDFESTHYYYKNLAQGKT